MATYSIFSLFTNSLVESHVGPDFRWLYRESPSTSEKFEDLFSLFLEDTCQPVICGSLSGTPSEEKKNDHVCVIVFVR